MPNTGTNSHCGCSLPKGITCSTCKGEPLPQLLQHNLLQKTSTPLEVAAGGAVHTSVDIPAPQIPSQGSLRPEAGLRAWSRAQCRRYQGTRVLPSHHPSPRPPALSGPHPQLRAGGRAALLSFPEDRSSSVPCQAEVTPGLAAACLRPGDFLAGEERWRGRGKGRGKGNSTCWGRGGCRGRCGGRCRGRGTGRTDAEAGADAGSGA